MGKGILMPQTKVFISYSRADTKYLNQLKPHLKPLERKGLIKSWDDREIKAGLFWKDEIDDALTTAKVAILLVSPSYLGSDFIATVELPYLVCAAKEKGVTVLPIVVSACGYDKTEGLRDIQAFNSPAEPLDSMEEPEQERFLESVADRVNELVEAKTKQVGMRRRRFILACAGCLLLGLIIGALVMKYWPKPTEVVGCGSKQTLPTDKYLLLVGGGSVYAYLKNLDPCVFININNRSVANVREMQIPTKVAAAFYAHTNNSELPDTEVMVMSSQKLEPRELERSESPGSNDPASQTPPEPPVFEAYLGSDTLQMLLVLGNDNIAKNEKLENVFSPIAELIKWDKVKINELNVSLNEKYMIYTGTAASATKQLWLDLLSQRKVWEEKLKYWDVQNPDQIANSAGPSIYLGSGALFESFKDKLNPDHYKIITLVKKSETGEFEDVKRGLYLYGRVEPRVDVGPNGERKVTGYNLTESATKILTTVYELLDRKVGDGKIQIDKDCITKQKEYFHLGSTLGWVEKDSATDGKVYRVGSGSKYCDRPPY